MNKKQWLTVIGGVIILGLAVFLIVFFNNTKDTAGEAVKEASKETEELKAEEKKELEKRAGIDDLVSIEEVSAALSEAVENGELGEPSGENTHDYEFIKEKFGVANADAYIGNYMYSETDSDFIKNQVILYYKIADNNNDFAQVKSLIDLYRENSFVDDEGTYKDDTETEVWSSFFPATYYQAENGFNRAGEYLIGYPSIGILETRGPEGSVSFTKYEDVYDNIPYEEITEDDNGNPTERSVYSSDGTLIETVKVGEPYNEKESKISDTRLISFYVLLEDDMKIEDAVNDFSNLNVLVNDEKAEPYGTFVEETIPNSGENNLKSLVQLDINGEEYLPKDGVIEIVYEIDIENVLKPEIFSNAETPEEYDRVYEDNVPTLTIEGQTFDLVYSTDKEEPINFQP